MTSKQISQSGFDHGGDIEDYADNSMQIIILLSRAACLLLQH